MARSTEVYLCYDLGGTKLRAAYVSGEGQILSHLTRPVRQEEGFDGLIALFRQLWQELPAEGGIEKPKSVAVASAGPLHPEKGVLLDPTNFFTGSQSWGVLPLVEALQKVFETPVILENDAAAAALAEMWKGGHGPAAQNLVTMTLGTGVGIGVIANGQLVRAGRGLHPELSHMPLNAFDPNYPCGCGAYGCIEAFLAGTHFARRVSAIKSGTGVVRELTGHDVVALARSGDQDVCAAFELYGEHLAFAIRALAISFAPEVVTLSGGFSHASDLFLGRTRELLPELLARYRAGIDLLPEIRVSKLQDDAGVLGAAYLAATS
ncbi:MAG: ROK family protein [Bdellovibrionales bacterium]